MDLCNTAIETLAFIKEKNVEIKKKKYFDMIVIIIIAITLITLDAFDLLEKTAKFMLIPILAFYYIGQYSERKLKK